MLYVDSLRLHQTLSQYVVGLRQLVQLFRGKVDDNSKLQVNIMPSMLQPSGNDCGVYAVAYDTELALKQRTGSAGTYLHAADARPSGAVPGVWKT